MLKLYYLVSTVFLAILSISFSYFKSDSASLKILVNIPGESGFLSCDDNSKTTNKYRIDLEYQNSNNLSSRDSLGCNKSSSNVGTTKVKQSKSYTFENQELIVEDLSPGFYKVRLSTGEKLGCLRSNGEKSIVYRIQEVKNIQIFDNIQTEVRFNDHSENQSKYNLSIFPNPTNSYAIISVSDISSLKGSLLITDLNGRLLKYIDANIDFTGSDYYNKFETDKLPSGVYIIVLKLIDGSFQSKKLVIL